MNSLSDIDIVSCRDDAINGLRNEMKEKNDELRRCKAKVSIQLKITITNTKPLKLRYLLRTNVLSISNHFLLSKLTQFEENNKLVDRKRLLDVTPSTDDFHNKGKLSHSDIFIKLCLKAHLHDATSRIRFLPWRMYSSNCVSSCHVLNFAVN